MRLATYNFQNLFDRVKVMNSEIWTEGQGENGSLEGRFAAARDVLERVARLNRLLAQPIYDDDARADIHDSLIALGLERSDEASYVRLRQNKQRLVRRPRGGGVEVIAQGRDDWIGWVELKREAVDEEAIRNTARVLQHVNADIVAAVEVEDRIPLLRFNEDVIPNIGFAPYDHVMAVGGNDDRGIDVGILSRGYPLRAVRSHVDDRDAGGNRIFSRDCACYRVETQAGALWLLVNHLKSKGGDFARARNRRRAQAERVRDIYLALRAEGEARIAVLGDFNDLKDEWALAPLFHDTDLRDVSDHPNYVMADGRTGTFGNCAASDHIDFILLSPDLFDRVRETSVCRLGIWGGKRGTLFPHFPTVTKPSEAASDHAAVWVDLDL